MAGQIETVPRPSWSSAAVMSASPPSARLRIASCKDTSAVRYWAWVNPRAPAALVSLHEAMRKRADDGDADMTAALAQLGLGTVSI